MYVECKCGCEQTMTVSPAGHGMVDLLVAFDIDIMRAWLAAGNNGEFGKVHRGVVLSSEDRKELITYLQSL
jgi:hypothetical protein